MEAKNSLLIVDDDVFNLNQLSGILKPDYTVRTVTSGEAGVRAAEKFLPDLILLDIMMPGMDGYQVFDALKDSKAAAHIPVVFITGLDDKRDEIKGLRMGAADYISKPFDDVIVKLRVRQQIQSINQTRLIIEKETAEKSKRDRGEFLSRMSHEMRTPMNAVMGMTALAKNTRDEAKRGHILDKISAASGQLLKMIDEILDMSDIEDGRMRLADAEFDFNAMLGDVLKKIGPDVQSKRQTLAVDTGPPATGAFVCDERRLSQVILHLLSNAVKFTPERGSIRLTVSSTDTGDGSADVTVIVADDGAGITAEQQNRLFIPFEQADGGVDRKYGGAGLGLPISRHIAALMGGDITVESEPGKGSKFMFTFKTRLKTPGPAEDRAVPLAGRRVLMAEDVEINREIVIAMLEETGVIIECAENGRAALDMFTSGPERYDVVLMDVNMPEMDGVEAVKRIRASGAFGARVPIVAMTANVLTSEVDGYLAAGFSDHIGKPIDCSKLISKLQKHIDHLNKN